MSSVVEVKILSYKSPQRFTVRRTLLAAQSDLRKTYPGLELDIREVSALSEIEEYTCAVILPSLVVDDKLVCIGRFPKKEEVVGWLKEAVGEEVRQL